MVTQPAFTKKDGEAFQRLREIVARLRAPDGCPWDKEQTHLTLRPFLLEEAYEVIAALDDGDNAGLAEEMGDVLLQILLHTQIAEEDGSFTMEDLLESLAQKLIRRHPHVFSEAEAPTSEAVLQQWDELKRAEREPGHSALHGLPAAMPALSYAQSLLARAAKGGLNSPELSEAVETAGKRLQALRQPGSKEEIKAKLGDLLFDIADYARRLDIDAEEALREAGHKFRRRFNSLERTLHQAGEELSSLSGEQRLARWLEARLTVD